MVLGPLDVSCVFLLSNDVNLLGKIQDKLGDPVDSYWNGSHTWFSEANETELEWRLHPVSGFTMPEGARPEELFELAIEGQVDPTHYWEGLEIFTFDDTTLSPVDLAQYCSEILGSNPEFSGLVDHEAIAQEFERSQGQVSIVKLLIQQIQN